MRALVVFADAGCNLTRAGEVLDLSQPAVHARLTALSRSLEVTLYERRGRRLALTEAGLVALARAREVQSSVERLQKELRGERDADVVTVACGEGALVHIIAARVAELARHRPGTLRFVIRAGPAALAAVRAGDADVAVVAGAVGSVADLKATTICSAKMVAVATPSLLPSASGRSVGVAELLALPLLVPPLGSPLRASVEEAAAAAGLRVRVAVEVSGWEAVIRLAQLGVGVGVINDVVGTADLVRRPIEGLPAVSYRALRRRGRSNALVDAVWDALERPSSSPGSVGREVKSR